MFSKKLPEFLIKNSPYFLALASGLLLAVSFPPSRFGWLVFFAFIPLLIALRKKSVTPKASFWLGVIAGLIFFAWGLRWFFSAGPLNWAGINSNLLGWCLIALVWLITALGMAVFWGLFAYTAKKFFWRKKPRLLLVAPLFVVAEYLRSWGTGLLWAGSEAKLGPFWTFVNPAYALSQFFKWRILAGLGGIYLIELLIIFLNCALLYLLWEKKDIRKKLLFAAVFLLLLAINLSPYFATDNGAPTETVFLVQTNQPSNFNETQVDREVRFQQEVSLLEKISQESFQRAIIFLPEDSRFLKDFPLATQAILRGIFADKDVLVVDSSRTLLDGKNFDFIYFYNSATQKIVAKSPKIFLMPGGEYLPFAVKLSSIIFGKGDFIERFNFSRQYFSGKFLKVAHWQNIALGGELCSAVMAPSIYRQATTQGAGLLFNLASHGIFKGSPVLEAQTLAMAQMRAAENNRSFVQAINVGHSFALDNRGNLAKQSDSPEAGYLRIETEIITAKSLYSLAGDWIVLVSLLALCVAIFKEQFSKR